MTKHIFDYLHNDKHTEIILSLGLKVTEYVTSKQLCRYNDAWFLKYHIILNVVFITSLYILQYIIMHLYISLGFYAFQSVFFAVLYDLWIIHSSHGRHQYYFTNIF